MQQNFFFCWAQSDYTELFVANSNINTLDFASIFYLSLKVKTVGVHAHYISQLKQFMEPLKHYCYDPNTQP